MKNWVEAKAQSEWFCVTLQPHENFASISLIIFHCLLPSHAEILLTQRPQIILSSFTQIMNIIPDAADWGMAAAWAYLPGQTSAFRSSYSYPVGVLVHEFDHNTGLHHLGYGTEFYADHSCLMGEIDTPAQCICNLQPLLQLMWLSG